MFFGGDNDQDGRIYSIRLQRPNSAIVVIDADAPKSGGKYWASDKAPDERVTLSDIDETLASNYGELAADTWMEGDITIDKDGNAPSAEKMERNDYRDVFELSYDYLGSRIKQKGKWSSWTKISRVTKLPRTYKFFLSTRWAELRFSARGSEPRVGVVQHSPRLISDQRHYNRV